MEKHIALYTNQSPIIDQKLQDFSRMRALRRRNSRVLHCLVERRCFQSSLFINLRYLLTQLGVGPREFEAMRTRANQILFCNEHTVPFQRRQHATKYFRSVMSEVALAQRFPRQAA